MESDSNLQYRADIDGLRAIAIIAVIAYHALPMKYHTGFIGVDIFFVISGFLITNILLKSLNTQSFSFFGFYQKRVLRLFPSLIVMLSLFSILAWLYFLPFEFSIFGRHLSTGTLFTNFPLHDESDYFDHNWNLTKPLVHFWSLAIEEQFYLLWPLLLFAFYRNRHFFIITIFICLSSFATNLHFYKMFPREMFYFLHGRAWELLIGCVLAIGIGKYGEIKSKLFSNLLSVFGALGLIASFFIVKTHEFPGWVALLPTMATAFLILAGAEAVFNKYILSFKDLVYVGKISYPLYLWHWPLFAFANLFRPSQLIYIVCCFYAFLFAALSYEVIEKNVKRASLQVRQKLFWGLSVAMLAFIVSGNLIVSEIWQPKHSSGELDKFVKAAGDFTQVESNVRHFNNGDLSYMVFGKGEEKILLFGDSHMRMYVPYFQKKMDLNRYTFYVVSEFSCKLMFSPDVNNKCMRFMNTALNISKTNKFSKVIIAGFWTSYFIFDEIATQSDSFRYKISTFDLLLKELAKSSDKLYVLEGVPVGNEFDPLFMIKRSFLNASWKIQPTAFNLKKHQRMFGPMINALRVTTEQNGGLFVRTVPYICPGNQCSVLHNGQPIYFDDSHLRSFYVLEKAHFLADIMDSGR